MVLQVDPSTGRVVDAAMPSGTTAKVLVLSGGRRAEALLTTGSAASTFTGRVPATGDMVVPDGSTAVAYGSPLTSIGGVITVAGELVDT